MEDAIRSMKAECTRSVFGFARYETFDEAGKTFKN